MRERPHEAASSGLAVSIRPARPDEAGAISALVLRVFEACVAPRYGAEGRDTFSRQATPEAFQERLAGGNPGILALELGPDGAEGPPLGFLELQDSHIRHFFVEVSGQRQGIGRRLLDRALALRPGAELTVNAAPNSEAAYARLGFEPAGPWLRADGITFRPMARRA